MKKPLILGLIVSQVLLIVVLVALAYNKIQQPRYQLHPQDDLLPIRAKIIEALNGMKRPAAIEARTGDIYFPEYKVYLPQTDELKNSLTYELYDEVLAVGTYPLMNIDQFYDARTSTELFDKLPKLQACERGIRISRAELPNDDAEIKLVLANELQQASGQTLYVYYEEACPDVKFLADIMADIKEY